MSNEVFLCDLSILFAHQFYIPWGLIVEYSFNLSSLFYDELN